MNIQTRFLLFLWTLAAFVSGDFYYFYRDLQLDLLILVVAGASLFLFNKKMLFYPMFFFVQVVVPYFYLPLLGNNATLRLIVSFFLFLDWTIESVRRRRWLDIESRISEHGRALGLAAILVYWISAFHKLNTDFLNPDRSCVRMLFKTWSPPNVVIYFGMVATFFFEAALPCLLFFSRFRFAAVIGLLTFHLILAGGYLDFSLTQIGLLCLFLSDDFLSPIYHYFSSDPQRNRALLAMAMLVSLPTHFPQLLEGIHLDFFAPGLLVVLFAVFVLALIKSTGLHRFVFTSRFSKERVRWVGITILLAIVINGFSPYLGLKTPSTFSMYSNLRVQNGWNHLILNKRFVRLFPEADDLVEIQASDDSFLNHWFVDRPNLITRFELQRHLLWQGSEVPPLWKRKLMGFMPVPKGDETFCRW